MLNSNKGAGVHQRASSQHLRNRRISDARERDRSASELSARSFHDHRRSTSRSGIEYDGSPYMPDHTTPAFPESRASKEWSPSTIENGNGPKPPIQQQHNHLRAPLSPPLTLPSGASTPALDRTPHGNPIATYPAPPPTWSNMPNKGQLAILCCSRFVDFFQMAALQTFMVHQLKSFDPELPDSTISHQAGMLQGAFTASQIITSILWGRAADQPRIGRKLVLDIGLVGTAFGCIGVGFSKTYGQAVFWRLMSGAINGTVGSARTMVAECTPKPWHPRAFLLLPAAFNFANVLGPILAGMMSEPMEHFPHLFGPGSTFGGETGIAWMKTYPYACANLISTIVLLLEAVVVHFFLEETLKGKRPLDITNFDPVSLFRTLSGQITSAKDRGYRLVQQTQREGLLSGDERVSLEMEHLNHEGAKTEERPPAVLPFRRIWTSNVLWVLLSVAIFDFHMGAFANLWILFLATPRQYIPENDPTLDIKPAVDVPNLAIRDELTPRSMFKFANGLGFPPPTIGFAMAIIGFIGVALQFLLYPYANARFGLMRCFRGSLFLFPAAYFLAPYIALLPSSSPPPDPASGSIVWLGISAVLFLQVSARTFALPATIILINNSSPHPSVLGTIHGIGQACSATFRTLGPILAGYWYGTWQERGIMGMAWWIVATLSAVGCVAAFWVRNGSGHEVFLPGEEGELKETVTAGGSGDGR